MDDSQLLYGDRMGRKTEPTITPQELSDWYVFPPGQDGTGQSIALIALAGGCYEDDLRACYDRNGVRMPKISFIFVDGAKNDPTGDPFDRDDRELMLDLTVAGSLAPGAHLAVYFAPNTAHGLFAAITTAVHDPIRQPSVISISWGGPEPTWSAEAVQSINGALQEAVLHGVTVLCSSGDFGRAGSFYDDGVPKVRFPASSPFVTACGGTRLNAAPKGIKETAWTEGWGSSGGGWSSVFSIPEWQRKVLEPFGPVSGRGVPDIAGYADPGYWIRVHGMWVVEGGTSSVPPLWAALCARINQALERPVGFLNPLLYQELTGSDTLRPIAEGIDSAAETRTIWNPSTGLGCLSGVALLERLRRR